jgi:hypothetical protein
MTRNKQGQQQALVIERETTQLVPAQALSSIAEVLSTYPDEKFNLVLPLRAPRSPETYELWCAVVKISPNDCARLPGGKFMPLKHKVLELAREAGVIVEAIEQVLPSTWRPIVELGRQLGQLPPSEHLSHDWIQHALQPTLQHRRNDVAVKASVLYEIQPGQFVRAVGTAEWIEEDEKALVERSVRRRAAEKGYADDEERIRREIDDAFLDVKRFRLRVAETKALLRAIRAVLSLKTAYDESEIANPFVVVSWRRVLSPEEIEGRWRAVFGDVSDETQRAQQAQVVEVVNADESTATENDSPVAVADEDDDGGVWLA